MLPRITDYYAEGSHQVPWFPEGMAEDSIPGYDDITPYGPGIVGRTIGFGVPARDRDSLAFLDTLASYVRQSVSLGWLTDPSLESKLLGDLSQIRSDLQNGKPDSGISLLHQILVLLEETPPSALTTEAHALMFYNIRYWSHTLATSKR
jgi:hypothetical protein